MRRVVRPEYFYRMRIEGNDDRGAGRFFGVFRRSGNYRLVPEMNAVENADGKEQRAGKVRKGVDRTKDVHENDE
jgi:hypothetical protein